LSSTEEVDGSDAAAQPLSASLATVYEASPRVGGRMHSDTTSWASGQVTEHCGELIESTHKTILGLAKRFRIGVADLVAAQPADSTDTNFFFGAYYTTAQADADFAPVYDALKRDVRAAGFPTLVHELHAGRVRPRSPECL
jgi:monoamine oxidase